MKASLKVKFDYDLRSIYVDDFYLMFIIKFREKGRLFNTTIRKKIMNYSGVNGGEVYNPELFGFTNINSKDELLGLSVELLRDEDEVVAIGEDIIKTYLEGSLTDMNTSELEITLLKTIGGLNKNKIGFDVDLGDDVNVKKDN